MSLLLEKYLSKHYGKLINRKLPWFYGGIVVSSLLALAIFSWAGNWETVGMFFLYYLITCTCIVFPIILFSISLTDRYVFGMVICFLYIFGGIIGLLTIEFHAGTPFYFPVFIPLICIHMMAYRRLPVHTPTGQKMMNEIEAYRNYLSREFSNIQNEKDLNQDKLKELPYVVALDVEARFTPFFNELLSKADYSPFRFFEKNLPGY